MKRKIKDFVDYKSIPTKTTTYEKKGTRWNKVSEKNGSLTEREYEHGNSKKGFVFMRNLGGYERQDKNYTYRGYKTTRRVSISPDKKSKIVTDFDLGNSKTFNRARKNYLNQFGRK